MIRSTHMADGIALSVAEGGEGLPFVFQHGLCGDAAQPAQVFPEGIGFKCITVECRGHGRSEAGPTEALSISTFAQDVAGYVEASKLDRPVIGGISMGAAISVRIAVQRPETIRALVLARPAWLTGRKPENMYANYLAGELLRQFDPEDARQHFEASEAALKLAKDGPDNLASIRGFFTREPTTVTSALLTSISSDGPGVTQADIRRIAVPTLVIGHERDAVHPLNYARTLANWIPDSRFVEITPKADDAEAYRHDFRAALARFLKEI